MEIFSMPAVDLHYFITLISVCSCWLYCPVAAKESIDLSSNINFSDDPVLCPYTLVQFECIGTNIEALQWRTDQVVVVYGIDTDDELLTDIQPSQPPGYNFSLASFDLTVDQGTRTANFTAILRIELPAFASEEIECFRDPTLSQNINVTYSTKNAPPAPLFATNFTRGMDSSFNLNFYWNESFTRAHAVEMYCISSVGVDECNTCVSPNTTFVCPQIMQGEANSFTVGAINCGSQQGENVTFTVNLQVPVQTNTCSSVPIYSSEPAGELIGIKNTWSSLPNPSVHDPNILNYIVSINATNDESVVQVKEVCLPATNQCEYVTSLSETREAQLQTIAVSVTAENVVGRGEPQPCSPTISTTNGIFDTLVTVGNESGTFVQCQFTTPDPSVSQNTSQLTEECVFCYGDITQSCDQQSLMCLPLIVVQDNRTGMASYELPEEFCYQITAIVDGNTRAVVSGRVEAECTLTDLGGGGSTVVSPPSDERCLNINAVGSVLIENGVICYNGTSTGSLATYHCNSGYQLKNGDGVQRCQNDSNWDGQMATCRQEPCLNAARFFFAVAVMVSIATILFGSSVIFKSRTISDKSLYTAAVSLVIALLCLLLVIIFYVSMEVLQQSQPLCVVSNLFSILSAVACVILSVSLSGIMYIVLYDHGGSYDIENKSEVQLSKLIPPSGTSKLVYNLRDLEDLGKHPSISVHVNVTTNKFIVIEVCGKSGWFGNSDDKQRELKYRIGKFRDDCHDSNGDSVSKILWGNQTQESGTFGHCYAKGRRPRVAMNGNGTVVVVHQDKRQCVYRIGRVNLELESFTVEWEGEEKGTVFAEEGTSPSVAINDDGYVIMTYYKENKPTTVTLASAHARRPRVNEGNGTTHFAVGKIGESLSLYIMKKDTPFPHEAKKLTVALNNNSIVMVSYRTDTGIYCMAGLLKQDPRYDIEWQSKRVELSHDVQNPNIAPVVSINSHGYFIVTSRITKPDPSKASVCYVGMTENNREITLAKEETEFDSGWNAAVAINSENQFLIVHEENKTGFVDKVKLVYYHGALTF